MRGKYTFLAVTSARSSFAYLREVAAGALFLAIILYIFMRLWRVTYASTGGTSLAGFTEAQMLWYLGAAEAMTVSRPRLSAEVDADIRTGSVAVQLLRPLSYPFYRLATHLGERGLRLGLFFAVAFAECALLTGRSELSGQGLALFALSLPLALLLDFACYFLIGLGAFWMEDTQGLTLLFSRLQMLLGGTLLPLPLFPEWMQPALRWLPFSAMTYEPCRLLMRPEWTGLGRALMRQGLALLVVGLAVAAVFRLAVRRVEAQGG